MGPWGYIIGGLLCVVGVAGVAGALAMKSTGSSPRHHIRRGKR